MSLLQEYDEVRRFLGNEKYESILQYCDETGTLLSDVLYNEVAYNEYEIWINKKS